MSDTPGTSTDEKNEDLSLRETFHLLLKASKGYWLINLVNFGDGIAYFGILTLLVLFLGKNVGMSDAWAGRAVSFFTGSVTLFMLAGGFIPDKFGVRRALTLALVILLGGRLLLLLSPGVGGTSSVALAWLSLAFMGLGSGIIQPTLYAGAKEYSDPRTAAVTFSLVYAIMNLGIVAENFISPFIRTDTPFINVGPVHVNGLGQGITGVFWFCTGVTVLLLIIQTTLFSKKMEQTDRVTIPPPKDSTVKKSLKEKLKDLPIADKRFLFFIFSLLPVQTLFAHQWLTIPDYIMRAYPPEVGAKYEWIAGINPFIIVIFVPLISALTRKAKVINMMIIGTTISSLVTFILVPGPGLARLLIYSIIFSLGEATWSSRFYEYVARLAPPGRVGAYMGIAGIPWFLAKFTTGLYSGLLLEKFVPQGGPHDTHTLWLLYGLMALASPVALIAGKRWVEKGVH